MRRERNGGGARECRNSRRSAPRRHPPPADRSGAGPPSAWRLAASGKIEHRVPPARPFQSMRLARTPVRHRLSLQKSMRSSESPPRSALLAASSRKGSARSSHAAEHVPRPTSAPDRSRSPASRSVELALRRGGQGGRRRRPGHLREALTDRSYATASRAVAIRPRRDPRSPTPAVLRRRASRSAWEGTERRSAIGRRFARCGASRLFSSVAELDERRLAAIERNDPSAIGLGAVGGDRSPGVGPGPKRAFHPRRVIARRSLQRRWIVVGGHAGSVAAARGCGRVASRSCPSRSSGPPV